MKIELCVINRGEIILYTRNFSTSVIVARILEYICTCSIQYLVRLSLTRSISLIFSVHTWKLDNYNQWVY